MSWDFTIDPNKEKIYIHSLDIVTAWYEPNFHKYKTIALEFLGSSVILFYNV